MIIKIILSKSHIVKSRFFPGGKQPYFAILKRLRVDSIYEK